MIDDTLKRWYIKYRHDKLSPAIALSCSRGMIGTGQKQIVSWSTFYSKPFPQRAGGERYFEKTEIHPWCIEVAEAHKVLDMRHTGWYTREDPSRDDLYVGVVLTLRKKRGFLAAYREECNGGYLVDFSEIYGDEDDAARAGDALAEQHADREREYNEAWQHGQDCDTAREEALKEWYAVQASLRSWRLLRQNEFFSNVPPDVVASMRATVASAVTGALIVMYERRAERNSHLDNGYHADHINAFNEGFGAPVLDDRGRYSRNDKLVIAVPEVETVSTQETTDA